MFDFLARAIVIKTARKVLNRSDREGKMKGWKTWAGGIGLMLTGAGLIAAGVVNDVNIDTITKGLGVCSAGLAAIGIGHKIEKAG